MDQVMEQTVRDGNGRFVPGSSGNPKGKAPGTRNRATVLRALMRDGDEDAIGRMLIDRALGGDPVAARFLIDGLNPKPRQRPIVLDVPADADAPTIFAAARAAMLTGNISPQEMATTMDAVERGERMVRAVADMGRADAAHRAVDAVRAAMIAAAGLADRPAEAPTAPPAPRAASPAPEKPKPVKPARETPPVSAPIAPPPSAATPTRRRAQERARHAAANLHSACKSTIVDRAPSRSSAGSKKAPRATHWPTHRPDDKLSARKSSGGNR